MVLYNRLRENPNLNVTPRTFFFAGKAAPAYQLAKVVIKFINSLAETIDGNPTIRGRLKVLFLPDYCVSLAERLIPASDVSNQISTAGYEASGTSNMKFMSLILGSAPLASNARTTSESPAIVARNRGVHPVFSRGSMKRPLFPPRLGR